MAVNRRTVIIGVVVIGGGLAGYEIYKYEKKKQAASQATTAAAAASGYGYGSAGSGATPYGYGASGYGYGYTGVTYGYGASGGFPAGYYGYGVPTPPTGAPPVAATTNAQWDQAAITQLEQDGYDPATISGALGAYLNGQQVNASQVNVVDAAIGIEGYPPVAGASGFPPGIKTGGTTGGGQGGGQTASVTVPGVVGDRADTARQKLRAAGLSYNISANATGAVKSQNPKAGAKVAKGTKVSLTLGK